MLKKIGIILVSIVIVAGIVILFETRPALGSVQTPTYNSPPQTASVSTSITTQAIQAVGMTSTPLSISNPTLSSQTEENVDPNLLIARMKILVDPFTNVTLQAGWLHLSNEFYQYDDHKAGTLSNGVAIPKSYIMEAFYHINEDKLAFEGVTFMKTLDRKIIQARLFKNNVFKDIITTEPDFKVEPFTPDIDGGVISDFSRLAFAGLANIQNKIEETIVDGASATEFDIEFMYDQPMKYDNYNQVIYGIEKRVYINSDGKLIKLDVYNFYQNETEILVGSSKNFIVENLINLPIEIQQYMQ